MKCKECRKLFASRDHLKIHVEKQHSAERLQCAECNGKPVKNMAEHRRNVHRADSRAGCGNLRPAPCGRCGKMFSTAYGAKTHEQTVHQTGGKKKSEVCPLCHKGFRDPRSLARHTKEVHAENSFECNVCGKFFPVKHSLMKHVQNVHHPTRSPCPYCELDVIHLAGHLTLTHGLKPSDAKDLVEATSGKEAARTDLQWTAFSQQKTNLID